ncbi:MAG: hypothetical protein COB09_16795 [Thalassobium sp.]|jgi:hypothetical protein|nr:MAG: hypothetical protein COB09_16795 [Thalassobium sp.]
MIKSLWVACLATALLGVHTVSAAEYDSKQLDKLEATVMSQNLPLEKRIRALKKLYADQLENGKINRSFCVWDMLGKAGPVFAAVDDQKFRSMHYGLNLTLIAYQDEDSLINDLTSGQCDAALISGSRALSFNRFSGTLEALGGIPDVQHLQMLMQVVASPKMAGRLQEGDYVVLGVASLGENYAYSGNRTLHKFSQMAGKDLLVPDTDVSLQALAQQLKAKARTGGLLSSVDQFVSGQAEAMLAPLVAYHVAGAGKAKPGMGILNMPLSQSTIQLIGRSERFPVGLAQILREDFLFKFDNYVRRVEKERANIDASFWIDIPADEQAREQAHLRDLRIALRDKGVYDPLMLKLQRKIRCKVDPARNECRNPVE